ncbi:dihydropteroate synthase [Candidatus Calescamantes bacterium]|nr:dihydropteroate synthase [Candidatus Calescamantes bacterium]
MLRMKIMGILNVTPDSFYDGGRYANLKEAVERAEIMKKEGVDIIDIGGVSTRPGSLSPSEEEEMRRVIPVVEAIAGIGIPLSIDTFRSKVAEECFKRGVRILNDVTALRGDRNMAFLARDYQVEVILMHMKGTPRDMQRNPEYEDVVKEVKEFFRERIDFALQQGIKEEKIWIDPGIGFGKTLTHNLSLLRNISSFKNLGRPVLVGPSRKSFIGAILNLPPEERLFGTLGAIAWCYYQGVDMVRVHDVKETKEMLEVMESIHNGNN